jgi:hypothetical protein
VLGTKEEVHRETAQAYGQGNCRCCGGGNGIAGLPSVRRAGSTLLLTGSAGAATRSAPLIAAAHDASSAVRITAVAGGLYHGLARSSNGAVFACGKNDDGAAAPFSKSGGRDVLSTATRAGQPEDVLLDDPVGTSLALPVGGPRRRL